MPQQILKRKNLLFRIAFALIVILALALRLPKLAQRPMHTDEAVHAIKFGELLEEGFYEYDPFEYHGPTLVYSTLIPAWLRGCKTLALVDERTLRIVPAIFGLALVLLLLMTKGFINRSIILFAALFTSISPAFVFYSRYYIMEIMLVFFTLTAILAAYEFFKTNKLIWAICAGFSLGLMHATKETCAMAWFAMAAAAVLTLLISRANIKESLKGIKWSFVLCGLFVALLISALFFSSFFSHPRGILDSIMTFVNYFKRGTGEHAAHLYPWFQYFEWLLFNKFDSRPIWSEAIILLLSIPGFVAIFLKRQENRSDKRLLQYIAIYTLILTFIYSVIPYKTPWSMLGFYHGFVIIAAVGAVSLFTWTRSKLRRSILAVLLSLTLLHLSWQSYKLNFEYEADSSNPYVYAHTDTDLFNLVNGINEVTSYWPDGKNTYIEVVCPGSDYWPLPWYLREYTNVGYFHEFDFDIPAGALIITVPTLEADLLKKLYEIPPPGQRDMYIPHFSNGIWLRPGVEIDLYVRKDVWDAWYRQSP